MWPPNVNLFLNDCLTPSTIEQDKSCFIDLTSSFTLLVKVCFNLRFGQIQGGHIKRDLHPEMCLIIKHCLHSVFTAQSKV